MSRPPHLHHSKIEHDRFIHGNVPLDTFWLASFDLGVFYLYMAEVMVTGNRGTLSYKYLQKEKENNLS